MTTVSTLLIVLSSLACTLVVLAIGITVLSVIALHRLEKFVKRHSSILHAMGLVSEFVALIGRFVK